MFLTSSDRPIDPELKHIVEEIERKTYKRFLVRERTNKPAYGLD